MLSPDTDETLLPTLSPSIDTELVNPNGDPTLEPIGETDPKPIDEYDRDVIKPIVSSKGSKSSGYNGKSDKVNSDLDDEGILEIEIDMSYDLLEEGSKSGKFNVDDKVLFNGKANKGPETEITYVLKPKAIKSNKEELDINITFINPSKAGKVSKSSTVLNSTEDAGYAKAGKASKGAKAGLNSTMLNVTRLTKSGKVSKSSNAALNSTMLNVTRLTKAGKVSKSSKAGLNSTVQNVTSLTYAKSGKVSYQMGNVSSQAISKSSKAVLIEMSMSVPIMLVNPETSKQIPPPASKVDDIPIRTSTSNNTDEVFDSDVVQIKPTSIPTDAPSLQPSKSDIAYEDIELIGVVIPQKPPSQEKVVNTGSPTLMPTPEDSIETTLFPTQELSMSLLLSEPPTALSLSSSPPPTTPKVDDTDSPTFMPSPDDSIETTLFPTYELSMPFMMSMPPLSSSIPTSTWYPNSKTAKHSDEMDRAIPDSDTPDWAKGVSFDGYHVKSTEFQMGYNPSDHKESSSASIACIYIAHLSIIALLFLV